MDIKPNHKNKLHNAETNKVSLSWVIDKAYINLE